MTEVIHCDRARNATSIPKIRAPKISDVIITVTVCLISCSLLGQIILLNSPLMSIKKRLSENLSLFSCFLTGFFSFSSDIVITFRYLLGFPVNGVLIAKTAMLFCFHAVGVCLFVLGCVVISLFAFSACQCDSCPQIFSPHST